MNFTEALESIFGTKKKTNLDKFTQKKIRAKKSIASLSFKTATWYEALAKKVLPLRTAHSVYDAI